MLVRPTLLALAAVIASIAPSPALARHSYTVRVPAFDVPANHNREICVFTPLPAKEAMDIGEVRIRNIGGKPSFATHHLIVYAYHGKLSDVKAGEVKDDTACLNFGSGHPSDLSIVATTQGPHARWITPKGTALKLTPDKDTSGKSVVGLVLNSHWINGDSVSHRARAKITLITRKEKDVKRELKPIFEVVANAFIDVPPGQTRKVGYRWAPANPGFSQYGSFLGGTSAPEGAACVTMLVGHMHKRGTLFTADRVDPDGTRTPLYRQTVYSDPVAKLETPPLLINVGQSIAYECTHDNATEPRLGCEEQSGVPPGQSVLTAIGEHGFSRPSGAAKLCTAEGPDPAECPPTDPNFSGHTFTGNCVKARLVFGFTSEDDMCILPGYYYDADPTAAPGQECTL
jgi:hypothetical protein